MSDDGNEQRDPSERRDPNEPSDEEPRRVKVKDKRMFGPDGELRDEYRFLQDRETREDGGEGKAADETVREPERQPVGEAPGEARQPPSSVSAPDPASSGGSAAEPSAGSADLPPGSGPRPTFYDLVSILAEPVAIYLGDAQLPDGRSAENLEMARLHIDLLAVLQEKSRGSLSKEEDSVLEDLLYRLRMRYVQKTRTDG